MASDAVERILASSRNQASIRIAELVKQGKFDAARKETELIEASEKEATEGGTIDRIEWEIQTLRSTAAENRETAAYSGSSNDGGASHLEDIACAMEDVMKRMVDEYGV